MLLCIQSTRSSNRSNVPKICTCRWIQPFKFQSHVAKHVMLKNKMPPGRLSRGPAAAHCSEAGGLFAHLYFTLTSTDSRYTRPKHVRTLLSVEPCSFLLLGWSQFMEVAHRLAAAQTLLNTSEVKLVRHHGQNWLTG
ncbi:TPA: hypothetical protein ACH3X3_007967 [Trebouxia sp. C0006]